jgi:hypothetical protein
MATGDDWCGPTVHGSWAKLKPRRRRLKAERRPLSLQRRPLSFGARAPALTASDGRGSPGV